MPEIFYSDEYATIEFDDSIPCVVLTLRGVPRFSEHYQLVQRKRLEVMWNEKKNYPKIHMLTDSRTAGPVLDEDVAHFKNYVLPEMEKGGIRYLAIVMPENKYTQLTIKEMTVGMRVVTVRYFDSMRQAKQWLKKMTIA